MARRMRSLTVGVSPRGPQRANRRLTSAILPLLAALLLALLTGMEAWAAGTPVGAEADSRAGAPADPDGARGYRAQPRQSGESWQLVPRLLLLPARAAVQLATWPIRTLGGTVSSTGLFDRLARAHERGVYLVPVAGVDPSLGGNFGFRAGHLNPLDRRGVITYRAAFGGTKEQLYSLTLRSRDPHLLPYRAGWSYKLLAKYEILPDKHYFGLGNTTRRNDITYYTLEQYLFLGTLRYAPMRWMACDLTLAVHRNQISPAAYLKSGQKSIERGFPWESAAPGLTVDPQNIQGEVAVLVDRRDQRGQPHAGWKAEAFFAYARGTGADGLDFKRYGGEGQAYLPLARAHTLALRVAGEEARTGDTDPITHKPRRIKLTELPSLGGRSTLRGYLPDRFIDNASALGTAEYRYRLSPLIEACVFADLGKVMPRLLDFDFHDLHRSFGAGLDFARADQFYFRLLGARSDEDWIFTATLEPVFDRQDRRERR
jgi:hypothetical protein